MDFFRLGWEFYCATFTPLYLRILQWKMYYDNSKPYGPQVLEVE